MTAQEVDKLYKARPFRPFIVHLADGRGILVEHPEFMASSPTGRTMVVYQPDGSLDIVDIPLIVDIEVISRG